MASIPQFETPGKALSYTAFALGICGCVVAFITLLAATPLLNAYLPHRLLWFVGFAILLVTVVLCLVSTRRQIGSGIITYRAEILVILSAVILVVAAVLGIAFR